MSDEDEVIPILSDVIVTGDLDKAVTDDSNLKSIDDFDALFETNNEESLSTETDDLTSTEEDVIQFIEDDSDLVPADEPQIQAKNLPLSDDEITTDILMDLGFESAAPTTTQPETETPSKTESLESLQGNIEIDLELTENNTLEDEFDVSSLEAISDETIENEISVNVETANINTQMDIEHIKNPVNTSDEDKPFVTESSPNTTTPSVIPPPLITPTVDINQLANDVMTEIMPAIEMQIKTLVLHSLKNHLTAALNTDNDTEDE